MMPAIYRAVDTYTKGAGDRKVIIIQLPDTTEEKGGSARTHPGELSHRRTAEVLAEYVRGMIG